MEGKGGFSVLYLFIALAASLLLSAAIAYLEIKRDTEIRYLTTKVYSLIEDVEYLKQELAKVRNESSFLISQVDKIEEELKGEQNYSAPTGEDDYYDDEYDDPETAEESRKRRSIKNPKRSINDPYSPNNLKTDDDEDEPIIKQTYSNSSPPPVVATIYLESPYQRQRGGPLIGGQSKPAEENACDYSKCMKNVAAHFDGNSSAARNGHHPHYDSSPGNHRMYHPNGVIREWTKASWVPDLYQDPTIIYDNGEVKLTDSPGLYFVYAQVFYADPHDSSGFRIYVNDDIVMQCTITSHGSHRSSESKRNSCYTGGLVKLNVDDKISVKEVEGTRYTIFEHTKSFFGLFRVAAM